MLKIFITYCSISLILGFSFYSFKSESWKANTIIDSNISESCHFDSTKVSVCLLSKLSENFEYIVVVERYYSALENDSCILEIKVRKKSDQVIFDSVQFTSNYLWESVFQPCSNAISFTPDSNHITLNEGFTMQDFIVGDFNFDMKEDFAIIRECPNSGPIYNYYIQNQVGLFELDAFLSDSVQYFPNIINKENRTLTTQITSGSKWIGEHVYSLDSTTNVWKEIRQTSFKFNKSSP